MPRKATWGAAVLLAAVVGVSFQGSRGLYASTEVRYAEVAREMLSSGNYLEPTLSGRPHWTKPPLTYMVFAGSMAVFGTNTWAVRLPNAVAFVLTTLCVWGIGDTLLDRKSAGAAALIYATGLLPVVGAHALSTDTLLTLWETAAVWAYARAWRASRDGKQGAYSYYVLGMYTCLGLAFLTKGPIGLLPFLVVLLWNRRQAIPVRLANPLGLCVGLGIGLGWFLVVAHRHPELWRYFVVEETIERAFTSHARRNPEWYKPFVLYLPPLMATVAPWLLVSSDRLRTLRCTRQGVARAVRSSDPHGLLYLWLCVPLTLLFLVSSRLVLYALPLSVPAALLMGHFAAPRDEAQQRTFLRMAVVLAALCVLAKGVAAKIPSAKDHAALAAFVTAHAAPDATLVSVDRRDRGLYGLEFYLQRVIPAVSETDGSLDTLLSQWVENGKPQPLLFVTKRSRAPYLLAVLDTHKLAYTTTSSRFWTIVRMDPKAPASPTTSTEVS